MENSEMNKENILKLAKFIDKLPSVKFNMEYWSSEISGSSHHGNVQYYDKTDYIDFYDCKTAGCIAGWAIAMENNLRTEIPLPTNSNDVEIIKERACKFLGLTSFEGDRIFFTNDSTVWNDKSYINFDIRYDNEISDDLITNKMAAQVLFDIAEERIDLNNLDITYYDEMDE